MIDGLREQTASGSEEVPAVRSAVPSPQDLPLAVDLDGTLVATDTLLEGALTLIRSDPSWILWFFVWLSRGRATFKAEIAKRSPCLPDNLPWRSDVIEFVRRAREQGRPTVLATAAHRSTAESVAKHLGLFDRIFSSTDTVNLKGARKRDALVKEFGARGFDYIGNSHADIPIWAASRIGQVAGHMRELPRAALAAGALQGEKFTRPRATLGTYFRAMRVYQWVKNLLVLTPALLNHHVDRGILTSLTITFLGFSLIASGTYVTNDLFDLEVDRKHPRKRFRPLASGELSIPSGVALAIGLVAAGFLVGGLAGTQVLACLLIYFVLTMTYSVFLKGKPVIDVITLAILYTLRVYAGGLVSRAYVSPWLFQFSVFLFLSLAFMKRYSELLRLRYERDPRIQGRTPGRNYRIRDLSIISQAGVTSGLLAGLVLALYVNGREIERLYPRPEMLFAVCPLFVYWIIRAWLVAHRGNMYDDPILFAFRDRVSHLVGLLILAAMVLGLIPNAG